MSVPVTKMRTWVVLEAPKASDRVGESKKRFESEAGMWAWVRPLTGRELIQAQQVQALTTDKVTIWFREGVTPAKRFNVGGRTLNIVHVGDPDGTHEVLECLCYEKTG